MPIPAPPDVVVTLDRFKEHLNAQGASSTLTDLELQDFLDAAVKWVEARKGPIVAKTVTDLNATYRGRTLVLAQAPVVSLTSVTDAYGTTVDISTHTLNPAAGIVYLAEGSSFGLAPLTVEYTAGRTEVDADLVLGVMYMAEHFAQSQRAPGSRIPSEGTGRSRDAYFSALDVLGLTPEQAANGFGVSVA